VSRGALGGAEWRCAAHRIVPRVAVVAVLVAITLLRLILLAVAIGIRPLFVDRTLLLLLAVAATLAVLVVAAAGFALGLVGKVVLFRKVLRVPREHFALKERRAARAPALATASGADAREARRLKRAEERRVRHLRGVHRAARRGAVITLAACEGWRAVLSTGHAARRFEHRVCGGPALAHELRRHVRGEQ